MLVVSTWKRPTTGPRSLQPAPTQWPRKQDISQLIAPSIAAQPRAPWLSQQIAYYGADESIVPGENEIIGPQVSSTAVEAVASLVQNLQDPVKRAKVLEVRIAEAKRRRAPAAHIAILQARLEAARRQAGLRLEGEQATRGWRGLGQGAVLVGIGVGLAVIYAVVKSANKRAA